MRAGAGLDGGHQTAEDSLTGPLPVSPHTASAAGEARGILSELAHPASLGEAHNATHRATSTSHHGRAHELGRPVHAQGAPARLDRAGCWYP